MTSRAMGRANARKTAKNTKRALVAATVAATGAGVPALLLPEPAAAESVVCGLAHGGGSRRRQ